MSYRRIKNIESGDLSDRLTVAANTVKDKTETFLYSMQVTFFLPHLQQNSIKDPSNVTHQDTKEQTYKLLLVTFAEIVRVVRLTAKSPFDLSLLDGADISLYSSKTTVDEEELLACHNALSNAFDELLSAAKVLIHYTF